MSNLIIPPEELERYGSTGNFAEQSLALLKHQQDHWNLCSKNYSDLKSVKTKIFNINNIEVKTQFNPGRIKSTSAKVDKASIQNRKCFLCTDNLPQEQRGIEFNSEYIILCNPYPIFPEHFTIINKKHTPQKIGGNFPVFLSLVKELSDKLTVFYNGPRCGASAPDHMHFQAGTKSVMPIEKDYEMLKNQTGKILVESATVKIYAVQDGLRRMFFIEGNNAEKLNRTFDKFNTKLGELTGGTLEPMMNIVGSFENGKWKIIIYPREKHRPDFYYLENEDRLTVSPAAVDMSGLVIVPREEDFAKLDGERLKRIYNQVTISNLIFNRLVDSAW